MRANFGFDKYVQKWYGIWATYGKYVDNLNEVYLMSGSELVYSFGFLNDGEAQVHVVLGPFRGVRVSYPLERVWEKPVDDMMLACTIASLIVCLQRVDVDIINAIINGGSAPKECIEFMNSLRCPEEFKVIVQLSEMEIVPVAYQGSDPPVALTVMDGR